MKLNPVDGLPEPTVTRKLGLTGPAAERKAKRDRLVVHLPWSELVNDMHQVGMNRPARFLLLLKFQAALEKHDGWFKPRPKFLRECGLSDSHTYEVVARLESLGLIEVTRLSGKRASVRLVTAADDRGR